MQKWLISWILPFIIAILVVAVCKFFLFKFHYVADDTMNSSLKKGDRAICLNRDWENRGDVVLINWASEDYSSFKRIIGLPNDTVFARHSIVFVNGKRFKEPSFVLHAYSFSTDSVKRALEILDENQIEFDYSLASIGVFQINASLDDLKIVMQDSDLFNAKRMIGEPTVSVDKTILNPKLYWNKDYFGPLVVPGKGRRINITLNNFYLYKPVIESESGKKLEIMGNRVYLSTNMIEFYEFKQNYYFVLNDNRQDIDDSRSKGFIAEGDILSKFWFKLPW